MISWGYQVRIPDIFPDPVLQVSGKVSAAESLTAIFLPENCRIVTI